jgi:hypothetical protein
MKNWLLPITVLGVSGLGLLLSTEKGREQLRGFFERMSEHGDPFGQFNKFLDEQLNTIQRTLDTVAHALEEAQG